MRFIILLSLLVGIAGCTDFPDLDGAISDRALNAGYPTLLPLDGLISSVPPVAEGLGVGSLPDRLRRLQARAANLRRHAVVDAGARARLQAALARHP